MDSKNIVSLKNSVDVHSKKTTGRHLKDFRTGSLSDITSPRQSTSSCNYVQNILSKDILNQKSNSSTTVVRNKIDNKDTIQILASECAALDDLSNPFIRELENKLQDLTFEIIKEKNEGHLLKRDIFVAKKVIEKEIAANTRDFETLLETADDKYWKGRHEIILSLKQKLRCLNESLDHLNGKTKGAMSKKKVKPKREDVIDIISDDRKDYWCLEFERRDVWKNAERYRQDSLTIRDLMKKNLQHWKNRNKDLNKEVKSLHEKLSALPKHVDKGIKKQLHDANSQLKTEFKKKCESKRMLEILQQELLQNNKMKEEFKTNLDAEKRTLNETEAKLTSLKENETRLQLKYQEIQERKCKQAMIINKKFESKQLELMNFIGDSEILLKELENSKHILKERKNLQQQRSSVNVIRETLSFDASNTGWEQQINELNQTELSNEAQNYKTFLYEKKLLKYVSIFQVLEKRNWDKLENLSTLIDETKEAILELLKNHYLMWKLSIDTETLKSKKMKLKKCTSYPLKQNFIKKKNSSHKMMKLEDRKIYLGVLKDENKCLKSLIKRLITSKQDEFDLLKIYPTRNKDVFLQNLKRL